VARSRWRVAGGSSYGAYLARVAAVTAPPKSIGLAGYIIAEMVRVPKISLALCLGAQKRAYRKQTRPRSERGTGLQRACFWAR
jgi:hypothetical protein